VSSSTLKDNGSVSAMLGMIKDMKGTGREWNDIREAVKQRFGVEFDKDQLKALAR
jgi:hypothetical protein